MYRPGRGASKASASTVCQKCLARGHYSYECTVATQQRPYKARPSRTQQLLNPDLKPKLMTEIPNDLLRRKGIADEILAKKEQQRSTQRRSISPSSHSDSDSISTISTNVSRPSSRSRMPITGRQRESSTSGEDYRRKRGRRSQSLSLERSEAGYRRRTRQRVDSSNPSERGRQRTRSVVSVGNNDKFRKTCSPESQDRFRNSRRGKAKQRSESYDSVSSRGRSFRRRSASRSPSKSSHKRFRISSRYATNTRMRVPRHDKSSESRSPYRRDDRHNTTKRRTSRSLSVNTPRRNSRTSNDLDSRQHSQVVEGVTKDMKILDAPTPKRERSLSPYSKRIALTRRLQAGN